MLNRNKILIWKWEEPRVVKARGSLYKVKAEYTTLQINNIIKLQINARKYS